jgi:7,8-dihydropterin-6-yl-methyl-4-(beta-D-ribofuranosyl)aminobenzene 5'-phosphate synthase
MRNRGTVSCDAAKLSPQKRAGQTPDDGEHELARGYVVKSLGLVVVCCCSHRGVLNAVRRAQALSGVDKIHAVVGGFHLVRPRTDEERPQAVDRTANCTFESLADSGPAGFW